MATSYPPKGARVNTHAPKTTTTAAAKSTAPVAATPQPRNTATFTPYYWEAYNEIVEPRRFDHYLIRKWLPDLGPIGFAVVKLLRDRCYHNPQTGVLRDTCEISMDELAGAVGVSRSFLFKLFTANVALTQFVRRIEQWQMVDGKPRREKNRYQVCMDDPIHLDDMERYDDLRAIKEQERANPPGRIIKGMEVSRDSKGGAANPAQNAPQKAPSDAADSYESTTETHSKNGQNDAASYKSTTRTHSEDLAPYESTTETVDTTYLVSTTATADTTYLPSTGRTALDNLPSGGCLLIDQTVSPAAPIINNGPKGAENDADSAHPAWWNQALPKLSEAMSKPTFQTHIMALKPLGLTGIDGGVEAVLECPSAFTREWIEKRHVHTIENALAQTLDCIVAVRLTQVTPGAVGK